MSSPSLKTPKASALDSIEQYRNDSGLINYRIADPSLHKYRPARPAQASCRASDRSVPAPASIRYSCPICVVPAKIAVPDGPAACLLTMTRQLHQVSGRLGTYGPRLLKATQQCIFQITRYVCLAAFGWGNGSFVDLFLAQLTESLRVEYRFSCPEGVTNCTDGIRCLDDLGDMYRGVPVSDSLPSPSSYVF